MKWYIVLSYQIEAIETLTSIWVMCHNFRHTCALNTLYNKVG